MIKIMEELADEIEFIDIFIGKYSRYLSNDSLKMLGQRKEIIKETLENLECAFQKYEKENKNKMGKGRNVKSEQVQTGNIQTESGKAETEIGKNN